MRSIEVCLATLTTLSFTVSPGRGLARTSAVFFAITLPVSIRMGAAFLTRLAILDEFILVEFVLIMDVCGSRKMFTLLRRGGWSWRCQELVHMHALSWLQRKDHGEIRQVLQRDIASWWQCILLTNRSDIRIISDKLHRRKISLCMKIMLLL